MSTPEENPTKPKIFTKLNTILAVLAALYTASPVDLIPDALFPVGFIDDLGVVGTVIVVITALYLKKNKVNK